MHWNGISVQLKILQVMLIFMLSKQRQFESDECVISIIIIYTFQSFINHIRVYKNKARELILNNFINKIISMLYKMLMRTISIANLFSVKSSMFVEGFLFYL